MVALVPGFVGLEKGLALPLAQTWLRRHRCSLAGSSPLLKLAPSRHRLKPVPPRSQIEEEEIGCIVVRGLVMSVVEHIDLVGSEGIDPVDIDLVAGIVLVVRIGLGVGSNLVERAFHTVAEAEVTYIPGAAEGTAQGLMVAVSLVVVVVRRRRRLLSCE